MKEKFSVIYDYLFGIVLYVFIQFGIFYLITDVDIKNYFISKGGKNTYYLYLGIIGLAVLLFVFDFVMLFVVNPFVLLFKGDKKIHMPDILEYSDDAYLIKNSTSDYMLINKRILKYFEDPEITENKAEAFLRLKENIENEFKKDKRFEKMNDLFEIKIEDRDGEFAVVPQNIFSYLWLMGYFHIDEDEKQPIEMLSWDILKGRKYEDKKLKIEMKGNNWNIEYK